MAQIKAALLDVLCIIPRRAHGCFQRGVSEGRIAKPGRRAGERCLLPFADGFLACPT